MLEIVSYKETLDRPPTLGDKMNNVGFEGFSEELKRKGWVDSDPDFTSLVPFKLECIAHAENDNNYIEWKATSK